MLREGLWGGRRILSEDWVRRCLTPCKLNADYGFLWWLNAGGGIAPAASRSSFFAMGVGANVVWVDPEHDVVAVVRWMRREAFPEFAEIVTKAVRSA